MRCTFIYFNFYNFFFFYNFFTIAIFTLKCFINLFTSSITVRARSSWLWIHSRSQHCHFCSHSSAFTTWTCWISSILSPFTFTFWTNSISIYCNFWAFSFINVFKCNLYCVLNWFSFFRSLLSSTSTSKHSRKNITSMMHSTTLKPFFSMLIINISFFFVT